MSCHERVQITPLSQRRSQTTPPQGESLHYPLSRTSSDPTPPEALPRYGDHPDWPAIWTAAQAELPNPDDPGWRTIAEWMATKEYQLPTPLTPGIVAGFARWARQNQWILPRKTTQTGPHKAGGVKKTGNS